MATEGRKGEVCGGFKVEGKNVKLGRRLVSRALDELSPYDVWGIQECMRCGVCTYTCPFWLDGQEATDIPAWRTYEVNKVYSMFYTGYGVVVRFLRLRGIKSSEFLKWRESAYNCTACGACTETSPLEIPNWYTAILLRRMLHLSGTNLEGAEEWAGNTKKTGNALGLTREEWGESAKSHGLPVDERADVLYVPSALEAKDPNVLGQVSSLFSTLKEKWTVSSQVSDVGYYAYLAGDFETAREQFDRVFQEAKRLGVKRIVTSDGSGFFFLRWQAPKSLGRKIDTPVEHLTETVYEAYRAGRVKVDQADVKEDTTVHDSEFMSRLGGVERPHRELMKVVLPSYREPKASPSSHTLFTCGHHLELLKEKEEKLKRVRMYSVRQLASWAKTVVTFDPNCNLSMLNGIKDGQGLSKSYYFTEVLSKAVRT